MEISSNKIPVRWVIVILPDKKTQYANRSKTTAIRVPPSLRAAHTHSRFTPGIMCFCDWTEIAHEKMGVNTNTLTYK